ncbi:MAG: hypothetical protein Q9228_004652 [Teloschistes exilis]
MPTPKPESAIDRDQRKALQKIRDFLKVRTSYDVLPLSFRLIIFDTSLLVKKSLTILIQNGIVSAPLWDSKTSTFAGLLTTSDYINLIQYYWQNPDAVNRIDQFKLNSLRGMSAPSGPTGVSPSLTRGYRDRKSHWCLTTRDGIHPSGKASLRSMSTHAGDSSPPYTLGRHR